MIQDILTFVVIFGLESVLSVDNAAVLAVCVNKLPENQRGKALRYGIWGAYLFRGLSLFGVSWLLTNPEYGYIAKLVGGGYLGWLVWTHFTPQADSTEEGNLGWFEATLKFFKISLPLFWLVVAEVEVLDLVFSLDNILAVTAMSDNLYVIIAAVFLAILSMRFVTQKMSELMERFPYLESRAYIVIGLIALKLVVSALVGWFHVESVAHVIDSEWFDMGFSLTSMLCFLPVFTKNK